MATQEETQQALLDAVQVLATRTPQQGNVTMIAAVAAAAKDLAEAYAWITSTGQPH